MRKTLRPLAFLLLLAGIGLSSAGCPWWHEDDREHRGEGDRGRHDDHENDGHHEHDDHHDEHH